MIKFVIENFRQLAISLITVLIMGGILSTQSYKTISLILVVIITLLIIGSHKKFVAIQKWIEQKYKRERDYLLAFLFIVVVVVGYAVYGFITIMEIPPTPIPYSAPEQLSEGENCHNSYPDVCISPPPPDLDCGDIPHRRFQVVGSDPHGFDVDKDGIGCESN